LIENKDNKNEKRGGRINILEDDEEQEQEEEE
jgi:hypothetical protein